MRARFVWCLALFAPMAMASPPGLDPALAKRIDGDVQTVLGV